MNLMLIFVFGVSKYIIILFKLIDFDLQRFIFFKKIYYKIEMIYQFIYNIFVYKKMSYLQLYCIFVNEVRNIIVMI